MLLLNKKLGPEDPALGRPGRAVTTIPFETRQSTTEDGDKDFELSERSEFSKSRYLRGAQGPEGRISWGPFLLVRFLWASKENEHFQSQ